MIRDLSFKQFRAAVVRRGGSFSPFGYVEFPLPGGSSVSICRYNGGDRRRSQLSYLLSQLDQIVDREAAR